MSAKLKLIQPELALDGQVPKPREVVAYGDGFLDLCRRAGAGEFVIEAMSVGRTPAEWVCFVRWLVHSGVKP